MIEAGLPAFALSDRQLVENEDILDALKNSRAHLKDIFMVISNKVTTLTEHATSDLMLTL